MSGGPVVQDSIRSGLHLEPDPHLRRLGDGGETRLGDMSRVSKLHPRVEPGTSSELNAAIGVALLAPGTPEAFADWLRRVQNDLLDVGADLGAARGDLLIRRRAQRGTPRPCPRPPGAPSAGGAGRARLRIGPAYTKWLEQACDEVNASAGAAALVRDPRREPRGGTAGVPDRVPAAPAPHDRRRRGGQSGGGALPEPLSDLLFILSRAVNTQTAPAATASEPSRPISSSAAKR